jgi:hypothetical protein
MLDATADTGGSTAPENTQDSANTTQAPGTTPSAQGHHSQRQPRDEAKRFTRKVTRHGKEEVEEATEDDLWRSKDEVLRLQHLNKASTERLQRASALSKEAETAKKVAQAIASKDFSSLRGYFEQNKLNPKEALADLLEAALQDETISPEQRELMALRAEKSAREEEDRRRAEDSEVEAFYKEVDALRPEVEQVWQHALTKTSLPKTAKMMEVTARIFLEAAEAAKEAEKAGRPAHYLSPEQVAEYARWELVEVNGGLVNELEPMQFIQHFAPLAKKIDDSMTAEDFEKALPNLAKRYHRMLVAKLKGGAAPNARGTAGQRSEPTRPGKPRQSPGGQALASSFVDDLLSR